MIGQWLSVHEIVIGGPLSVPVTLHVADALGGNVQRESSPVFVASAPLDPASIN